MAGKPSKKKPQRKPRKKPLPKLVRYPEPEFTRDKPASGGKRNVEKPPSGGKPESRQGA